MVTTNASVGRGVTCLVSDSVTRTPPAELVHAVQPDWMSFEGVGSRSGAPGMPMVWPCFCLAISSSGTKFTSNFPSVPSSSRAEVVLMTG